MGTSTPVVVVLISDSDDDDDDDDDTRNNDIPEQIDLSAGNLSDPSNATTDTKDHRDCKASKGSIKKKKKSKDDGDPKKKRKGEPKKSVASREIPDAVIPIDLASPTPSIYDLFRDFDSIYFKGKLSQNAVMVGWSTGRMTLCAGVCKYKGRAGGIEIVLSEPLLKFRSQTELKETLLHEMIHALNFLEDGISNRDGHGEQFLSVMRAINTSTNPDPHRPSEGYKISVYHTFRDEVDFHRKHHWSCQACGKLIKRSMNRPPSEKDCRAYRKDKPWRCQDPRCYTHAHMRTCGGPFVKIKSPPDTKAKENKHSKKRKTEKSSVDDKPKPNVKTLEKFWNISSESSEKGSPKDTTVDTHGSSRKDTDGSSCCSNGSPKETVCDEVDTLVTMGFSREAAQHSMDACQGNVAAALELLLGTG